MPVVSKEVLHESNIDDIALKEVDGYIDRIEKQAEKTNQDQTSVVQPTNQQKSATPLVYDDMGQIVMQQFKASAKPKIILPLTEDGLRIGMGKKIYEGIRWLAEWSVYMIRKYPGRVFFKSKSE